MKIYNFLKDNLHLRFYIILSGVVLAILLWIDGSRIYDSGFQENILVEAHGLLFDIIFLGVIYITYDNFFAKPRIERKRYREELSDYKDWKEPEAVYRIAGTIKRLNRLDETEFQLQGYYLENANLEDFDLSGSLLMGTNLKGANLIGTKFNNCRFWVDDKGSSDTILENAIVDKEDWFQWLAENGAMGISILKHKYRLEKIEIYGGSAYKLIIRSVYEERGLRFL